MRWNLVTTFGLSCKEAEKEVAWLSLVHCEMLDYACTDHFFIMKIDFSKITPQVERKKKETKWMNVEKGHKSACVSPLL